MGMSSIPYLINSLNIILLKVFQIACILTIDNYKTKDLIFCI